MQQQQLLPLLVLALVLSISTVVADVVSVSVYWELINEPNATMAELEAAYDNEVSIGVYDIVDHMFGLIVPSAVRIAPNAAIPEENFVGSGRRLGEEQEKNAELQQGSERRLASSCPKNCKSRKNKKICRALGCEGREGRRRLWEGVPSHQGEFFPIEVIQKAINCELLALGNGPGLLIDIVIERLDAESSDE
jgi:hypothetical protein